MNKSRLTAILSAAATALSMTGMTGYAADKMLKTLTIDFGFFVSKYLIQIIIPINVTGFSPQVQMHPCGMSFTMKV